MFQITKKNSVSGTTLIFALLFFGCDAQLSTTVVSNKPSSDSPAQLPAENPDIQEKSEPLIPSTQTVIVSKPKDPDPVPDCPVPVDKPGNINAVSRWGIADRTYSVDDDGSYEWRVPDSWTIVSGKGSKSIDVGVSTGGPAGKLEVAFRNDCGAGPFQSIDVAPVMPGVISTAAGLAAIGNSTDNLAATWDLAINIDLTGTNWQPLGNDLSPFKGIFRGNGFNISNLKIERPDTNYLGLFGFIDDETDDSKGKVADLFISGVNINQDGAPENITTSNAGALVGRLLGTVSSVVVDGNVSCASNCGGLAGYSAGIITSSGASGTVLATGVHGAGLVGDHRGIIRTSRARVAVSAGQRGGGLVGLHYPDSLRHPMAEITDSYATGTVTQTGTATPVEFGGLAARMDFATIRRSYASGNVSTDQVSGASTGGTGGLVGYMLHGLVIDSFASGEVKGHTNIGGLAGMMTNYNPGASRIDSTGETISKTSVSRSYATGKVDGYGSVGGFVGRNRAFIDRSFATGNVTASINIGGFVGLNYGENTGTKVANNTDCYATGTVTGLANATNNMGSFSGRSDNAQFVRNYALGAVSAGTVTGGFLGSLCCTTTFTEAFWNEDTTGYATSAGGTKKNTSELQDGATFATWDLTTVWDKQANAYPLLKKTPWDFISVWKSMNNALPVLDWE